VEDLDLDEGALDPEEAWDPERAGLAVVGSAMLGR
jgi:hypothetical protein